MDKRRRGTVMHCHGGANNDKINDRQKQFSLVSSPDRKWKNEWRQKVSPQWIERKLSTGWWLRNKMLPPLSYFSHVSKLAVKRQCLVFLISLNDSRLRIFISALCWRSNCCRVRETIAVISGEISASAQCVISTKSWQTYSRSNRDINFTATQNDS